MYTLSSKQQDPRARVIVALDCDERRAFELASALEDQVQWLKVGMTLFYQAGPSIVTRLTELGFSVFLDLKLHDIPHQVHGACQSVAKLGARMLSVHASGGSLMIERAKEGLIAGATQAGVIPPALLAISVLTSMDQTELASIGVDTSVDDQVAKLAQLALSHGADGMVSSGHEAARIAQLKPGPALIVTPGVRLPGATSVVSDDQTRVLTPRDALMMGATHVVIGRPITQADDPQVAFEQICQHLSSTTE